MSPLDIGLLVAAGLAAGVVNTLAGGGSLISVPLLVALGLPGDVANGTNRIGVLFQNGTAAWRFRAEGISGFAQAWPLLWPVAAGSLIGAAAVSQLASAQFERLFGVVMVLLLIPTLRQASPRTPRSAAWSPATRTLVLFAIGLYGGAIQAGVGLFLMLALARAGYDLVSVNSIKVIVIGVLTALAIPVFIFEGQVAWGPAACLTLGFSGGGAIAVRWTIRGGERLIRTALVIAVFILAGHMLGLY
ncbi:MAG: sulfite exporter TauE/SafE family protein [Myxococcota bacterium]